MAITGGDGVKKYQILGSLHVSVNGVDINITARKMEILLATLLIQANQVVSREQLMAEIWGESTPTRATACTHVYISQLRKLFGKANPIITRGPGYLLCTAPGELDLSLFQQLAAEGRQNLSAGCYREAHAALAPALALWRGPALVDLRNGPIVNGFVSWLDEVRLECTELLIEADLQLGRHRELVSLLYKLIGEYPLHETFYRQLMIALYQLRSSRFTPRIVVQ